MHTVYELFFFGVGGGGTMKIPLCPLNCWHYFDMGTSVNFFGKFTEVPHSKIMPPIQGHRGTFIKVIEHVSIQWNYIYMVGCCEYLAAFAGPSTPLTHASWLPETSFSQAYKSPFLIIALGLYSVAYLIHYSKKHIKKNMIVNIVIYLYLWQRLIRIWCSLLIPPVQERFPGWINAQGASLSKNDLDWGHCI